MITVMKFGGTSVGSVEALTRVAKIIVNEEGKKVVVVSAMSGITNFLVSAVEENKDLDDVIETFREKHLKVANELFKGDLLKEFMKEFEERFDYFKKVVLDEEMKKDPFYEDNVSSQGERFSSLLLA